MLLYIQPYVASLRDLQTETSNRTEAFYTHFPFIIHYNVNTHALLRIYAAILIYGYFGGYYYFTSGRPGSPLSSRHRFQANFCREFKAPRCHTLHHHMHSLPGPLCPDSTASLRLTHMGWRW